MAKYRFECASLCLFLIVGISSLGSSTGLYADVEYLEANPFYAYTVDSDSYRLQKRDIRPEPIIKIKPANLTTSTELPTTTTDVATTKKVQQKGFEDHPVLKLTQKKKVAIMTSGNSTDIRQLENLTKNLGENGAGQRKMFSDTTVPPPLIHNTNVDNKIYKSSTTEPDLPSDFDTEEGEKKFNETLRENNITTSKMDENKFYKCMVYNDTKMGQFYWVNMSDRSDVKVNDLLSDSHRRAATVKLSFEFPFYGQLITNVTIATGGFLYTGDYVHSWLAATQYIAPLMANFDTSLSNDSFIRYADNGTAFTVEWDEVTLQDRPKEGDFTFQVTLFKNGDIVFVYKEIPLHVEDIQELQHPVKVGLSDAYIIEKTQFLVRRKTVYEYDRFHLNKTDLKDWSAIYLKALPTCLDAQDCVSCLSRDLVFKCQWCPAMRKCSEGFDRFRQDWLAHGCDTSSVSSNLTCPTLQDNHQYKTHGVYDTDTNVQSDTSDKLNVQVPLSSTIGNDQRLGVSGVMAVIFLVTVVFGMISWVFYAYRNPHTPSGQMLIRYRPSQWRWRRGEARYTAATIHM